MTLLLLLLEELEKVEVVKDAVEKKEGVEVKEDMMRWRL